MNRTDPIVGLIVPVGSAVSPGGAQGIEGAVGEALPIGTMLPFSGDSLPDSFLWCDGASYPRVSYPELAAILGTVFGGDANNFNVPDCRGRVLAGGGANSWVRGGKYGAYTHQLTVAELASHTHIQDAHNHLRDVATNTLGGGAQWGPQVANQGVATVGTRNATATNQNTGGNGAHNNVQPTLGAAFIIKAERLGRIGVLDAPSDDKVYGRKNAEWVDAGIDYDGAQAVVADNMVVQRSGNAAIAGTFSAYGNLTVSNNATIAGTINPRTWTNVGGYGQPNHVNNTVGIRTGYYDDGTNLYCECLRCNPAWADITLRVIHLRGVWAGFQMILGSSVSYQFQNNGMFARSSDGATVQWVASDARHKRDIGPCEIDALAFLRKIPIAAYTQVKDGVRRACGWVAQQVEKVAPEWVFQTDVSDVGETGKIFKRVEPNDQGLPWVIRAIQQLDERLTKLEAKK